ncbi:thiol-disulfide oxidoreductase DCC family protein [Muricoccus vinaceus]|uniref:DUF393 domain-containing protein n=1 Tax=Muricoccus vinaceus TaxID=424704 RepID=A0ABV6IWX3_9PROT
MTDETGRADSLTVVYDGECPFCTRFVELYRIRENVGKVVLTDARDHPELVAGFRQQGFEINDGMVVLWQGRTYYGVDAMQLLSMLGTEGGSFAALNRLLFRNKRVAGAVYPWLVRGRKMTLRLLGRDLIDAPGH